MPRPYLHTCGCPSPSPQGSPLKCKQHAWEFTNSRIAASNNRYGTVIRSIDTSLARKRGDLGRLRDAVWEMVNLPEEWGKEIEGLEKEIGTLEGERREAVSLMWSYEVLAKGEYGYGVWREGGSEVVGEGERGG